MDHITNKNVYMALKQKIYFGFIFMFITLYLRNINAIVAKCHTTFASKKLSKSPIILVQTFRNKY